jgi:hypothetical protein
VRCGRGVESLNETCPGSLKRAPFVVIQQCNERPCVRRDSWNKVIAQNAMWMGVSYPFQLRVRVSHPIFLPSAYYSDTRTPSR